MAEEYLNRDQRAHLDYLARNPEKVCGCGWETHFTCRIYCPHPDRQLPEDRKDPTHAR